MTATRLERKARELIARQANERGLTNSDADRIPGLSEVRATCGILKWKNLGQADRRRKFSW